MRRCEYAFRNPAEIAAKSIGITYPDPPPVPCTACYPCTHCALQVDTKPLLRKGGPCVGWAGASSFHVPRDASRDERLARLRGTHEHGLGDGGKGNQGGRHRWAAGMYFSHIAIAIAIATTCGHCMCHAVNGEGYHLVAHGTVPDHC